MRSASVHDLKAALDAGAYVVDVRQPHEYAAGHVPGAVPMPLQTVPQHAPDVPLDRQVFLVCAIGARSARAAMFLAQHGVDAINVDGGTEEWVAAGYPLEA